MTRYQQRLDSLRLEGRSGLVAYLTAGDPLAGDTAHALLTLSHAGADLIELGMPFSDPMADGPTLQRAAYRALETGETVSRTLASVKQMRQEDNQTPLILMGYSNPLWQYGIDAFCHDAAEAGVDGLLIVDLPIEHDQALRDACQNAGLLWPRMVAPGTADERVRRIADQATGFLYLVARNGVTGGAEVAQDALEERLKRVKTLTDQPLAVGFGLRTADHCRQLNGKTDWIVVGSAIHEMLEAVSPEERDGALRAQVQELRGALTTKP